MKAIAMFIDLSYLWIDFCERILGCRDAKLACTYF